MMEQLSTQLDAQLKHTPARFLPSFWTLLLCFGLAMNAIGFAVNHPEQMGDWRGFGLVLLLAILLVTSRRFTEGRIYRTRMMSEVHALITIGVQTFSLLLLVWRYEASFTWFSISIVYYIMGGLPKRSRLLPLIAVVVVMIIGLVPIDNRVIEAGSIISSLGLFLANLGIAIFISAIRNQRDQLRVTSEQLKQANAALEASAAQAEELAVLRERTRLARAIHDDLGHALVLINVKLEAAELLYARDPARGASELEATRGLVRSTMGKLRQALTDLRAPITNQQDLSSALRQLAHDAQQRTGVSVMCQIAPVVPALPATASEALWYVAREALTNAVQHGGAAKVTLSFEHQADGWWLRILDDGSGIQPSDLWRPDHFGIVGMRERISAVGGTFTIQRGENGGTIVEVYIPTQRSVEARAS